MDREVSHTVHLSVTLIALSVVIALVMYTIYVGNDLKRYTIEKAVDIETNLSTGQLNSLSGGDPKIITKASAYYILSKEYSAITELNYVYKDSLGNNVGGTYKVNNNGLWTVNGASIATKKYIFPADIIDETGINGKVSIFIERLDRGMYKIIISDVDLNS